eukprot:Nk52_evm1s2651 gene=Nk52_evmTU1s2651
MLRLLNNNKQSVISHSKRLTSTNESFWGGLNHLRESINVNKNNINNTHQHHSNNITKNNNCPLTIVRGIRIQRLKEVRTLQGEIQKKVLRDEVVIESDTHLQLSYLPSRFERPGQSPFDYPCVVGCHEDVKPSIDELLNGEKKIYNTNTFEEIKNQTREIKKVSVDKQIESFKEEDFKELIKLRFGERWSVKVLAKKFNVEPFAIVKILDKVNHLFPNFQKDEGNISLSPVMTRHERRLKAQRDVVEGAKRNQELLSKA